MKNKILLILLFVFASIFFAEQTIAAGPLAVSVTVVINSVQIPARAVISQHNVNGSQVDLPTTTEFKITSGTLIIKDDQALQRSGYDDGTVTYYDDTGNRQTGVGGTTVKAVDFPGGVYTGAQVSTTFTYVPSQAVYRLYIRFYASCSPYYVLCTAGGITVPSISGYEECGSPVQYWYQQTSGGFWTDAYAFDPPCVGQSGSINYGVQNYVYFGSVPPSSNPGYFDFYLVGDDINYGT